MVGALWRPCSPRRTQLTTTESLPFTALSSTSTLRRSCGSPVSKRVGGLQIGGVLGSGEDMKEMGRALVNQITE